MMKKIAIGKKFKITSPDILFLMYSIIGVILMPIFRSNVVAFIFPLHTGMYAIAEMISVILLKFFIPNSLEINLIASTLTILTSAFIAKIIKTKEKWNTKSPKGAFILIIALYLIFLLFAVLMMFTLWGFFI